jgi:hypothetical protein
MDQGDPNTVDFILISRPLKKTSLLGFLIHLIFFLIMLVTAGKFHSKIQDLNMNMNLKLILFLILFSLSFPLPFVLFFITTFPPSIIQHFKQKPNIVASGWASDTIS